MKLIMIIVLHIVIKVTPILIMKIVMKNIMLLNGKRNLHFASDYNFDLFFHMDFFQLLTLLTVTRP